MDSLIGKATLIGLAGFGVVIDKISDAQNGLIIYFSVPQSSTHKNVHGQEMAGQLLAMRVKETLIDMGVKAVFKYRIRLEDWNDNKRAAAEDEMKREIFGSFI